MSTVSITINAEPASNAYSFVLDNLKCIAERFTSFLKSGDEIPESPLVSIDETPETQTIKKAASYIAQKSHKINMEKNAIFSTFEIANAILKHSEIRNAMKLAGDVWEKIDSLSCFESEENFEIYLAGLLLPKNAKKFLFSCCS
jgi:hypothetical protein